MQVQRQNNQWVGVIPFTLPDMPTQSAQTIYELVQGRKNAELAFFPE